MTKIKNSKKGMAKKTLSISLAVAMLATSNVPVWAAEDLFTDGEVAVEAFTSEAEAPAIEEAPVAEEVEVTNNDSSISNPKTTLALSQSGWANLVKTSGEIYDENGELVENYAYAWVVDGKIGNEDHGWTNDGRNGITLYRPTANDIGKKVELHVYTDESKIGNDFYFAKTNAVTITTTNVELGSNFNYIAYNGEDGKDINHVVTYNGKNQYCSNFKNVHAEAKFDTAAADLAGTDDFKFTCELKEGNGIDAGSVFMIKATPKDHSLYTGTLRYDYKITEKDARYEDFDFSIAKTYEYTGNKIVPAVEDIKVVDKLSGTTLDSTHVIKNVDATPSSGATPVGVKQQGATVWLNNVPNYTEESLNGVQFSYKNYSDLLFTVTKRDLSNCDIVIDAIEYTGEALRDNDDRFAGKVHFFDRTTGEELNLDFKNDYAIDVKGNPTNGTTTYELGIESWDATGVCTRTTGYQLMTFTLANETFKDQGYTLTPESRAYLEKAAEYTGDAIVKDTSKVVFTRPNGDLLSTENYTVEVYGKDAGKKAGKVVIKGLKSYDKCEEVYYFDINAAKVTDVTVDKKVVYVKGYTKAAQYAPKVTVTAKNADGKEFVLTADDFKVDYRFQDANRIDGKVLSKVQILNKNFKGGETLFDNLATLIAKRDLSKCTVTPVKDSYVYTGGVIKPELKVMDGNETLAEGVDYEVIELKNATDVGTATVVIRGIGNNHDSTDGIYDNETTNSATFEITPANAADIEVVLAEGNTETEYTGNLIKPTVVKVTLNGNDVKHQFDIEYSTENINVGTGHVLLKPVYGNKNFTGVKDAEFQITPKELTGTLKVYDEKGRQYEIETFGGHQWVCDSYGRPVSFAYDGTAHTFAKAEFIPDSKLATSDDYEIVYVDNTYGKAWDATEWPVEERGNGLAYIAVIGKGNFKGSSPVTDASGDVFNTVAGAAYRFGIRKYEILKQHVTIEDGEYAAGQPVRPNVTVTVGGKTLVENQDYVLEYNAISDLTDGKTMYVTVEGINGYRGFVTGTWGVGKRNMENTQIVLGEGRRPNVTVYNSGVKVPSSEYTVAYEADYVVVTAKEDSKYYTGSAKAEYITEDPNTKPGAPVITGVVANGNKVTVSLAGEATGAVGYDYVLSTSSDCIDTHVYDKVNKNKLTTDTTFQYAQQGTYYAYCHAWKRDENGKKIFSDWSNPYVVVVGAITPEQPTITSVKQNGSTVTVTYSAVENADGYDVVLGTEMAVVNDEKRPVKYGELVKKNIKNGKVTATFKNVPAGRYYVGLHAYNRTSVDGKKVFSPWSVAKKVYVK